MSNRCADNVVFVQCILPHREYLFSKFSPKITHEGKKLRWMYIRDQLVANGMAHFVGKDDSYMRQKWADMKRRTIEKLSRMGQNSRANLSEVDILILRIIGDKEATDGAADLQTHKTNSQNGSNLSLNVEHHNTTVYNENELHHQLQLNQQAQTFAQTSANLSSLSSAKCEPNAPIITLPLQHRDPSPQKVPQPPQPQISSSAPPVPGFTTTVTENGIPLPTTLRRKRKKFLLKRNDRMPKPCCSHCQNEKRLNDQHQSESGDLDEQIKRAKLAYYKSQIDLNSSLKSESILRKRLLTLQIEQIQQEIEGEAEEIDEH
ncbi:hypothetical protein niasHT_034648 [Heterodera trifolii]|uniref:Regulatory protein zeste n=1 Tax=Heterodera trifolii TaxID=157864 RepID=A0ABD2J3S0_9BILA